MDVEHVYTWVITMTEDEWLDIPSSDEVFDCMDGDGLRAIKNLLSMMEGEEDEG